MKINILMQTIVTGGVLLLSGTTLQGETLRDAVEKMLNSHPEVRSSAYNALARDQEVRQAWSGYLPTLDFSAGYGVQDIQEPVDETLHPQVYTLSLRQNIFRGFSTMNEVERQKARVRSEAFRLHGTSDFIALRTSEVYLNVLRHQELLRLAEENLNNHLRIGDQIKLRSDSGVSSSSDNEQVQGRVALARSNVVVAKINLADAESNYLAVVGNLPGDLQKPQSIEAEIPSSLETVEAQAVEKHPVLKSANADLEARNKQYEVSAAPYWPIVDIEVDQNWEEDFDEEGRDDNLVVMLRLRYNLFNGFRDDARRAETRQLINEAREIKNNSQRQVIESVRLSWMAHRAVLERIDYLEQRVESTLATADSYVKQFNLGKRTLLDVLDTEAESIDAKRALVDAQYDGLFSQYRIVSGFGGLVKSFGLELPEEAKLSGEES